MSDSAPRSWKAVIATLVAIGLLAGAYLSAWAYTTRYAGLTASRTSPAPFVIVERQSGMLHGLDGNKLVVSPFRRFAVSLWCAGAEVEVMSHMEN
ncbi:MAG TPA: hypothetical protein VGN57_01710 [Pirellulaceae bacterium]|jgi:hypothetical protein|nr:hypothetical protein [Pirellulaceae bacterium]